MRVTGLEPVTKNKFKVYLDDEFAFALYKGELLKFNIEEGCQMSSEQYHGILENIVIKRGKRRALFLLERMGRTETQLRDRLESEGYPATAVNIILEYVGGFGYINDKEYARHYIETRKQKKSRQEIYGELCRRGLNQELIDIVLEEIYEEGEEVSTLVTLMQKRKIDFSNTEHRCYGKHIDYFSRKGFSYRDILKAIEVLTQEEFSKHKF